MGRRARRREHADPQSESSAPDCLYSSPAHGELVLRGVLSAKTRREYERACDPSQARAAAAAEDIWARAGEFLFERLAVRWTVEQVQWSGPKELLMRYRASSPDERQWIRSVLREHLALNFPEMRAP